MADDPAIRRKSRSQPLALTAPNQPGARTMFSQLASKAGN